MRPFDKSKLLEARGIRSRPFRLRPWRPEGALPVAAVVDLGRRIGRGRVRPDAAGELNAMASGNDIIGGLMAKVDALGAATIQSLYASLGASLEPVFVLALSVYVAFWGYQLVAGRQGVSAGDALIRVARIAFIYTLAFSWGDFSTLVVNSLTNLPNAVGDAICSAVGGTNCSGTDAGVTQGLSSVWTAAMTVSTAMANNSGMFGLAR